jgi:hypothetical protein
VYGNERANLSNGFIAPSHRPTIVHIAVPRRQRLQITGEQIALLMVSSRLRSGERAIAMLTSQALF